MAEPALAGGIFVPEQDMMNADMNHPLKERLKW